MNGAAIGGTVPERVEQRSAQGDIGLVCNDRAALRRSATLPQYGTTYRAVNGHPRFALCARRSEARPEQCHFDAVASVSS